MKTIKGTIKKAVIEMLILKLLSESDMYGYQITQEFKKRSSGEFTILQGSLYPILYRLADDKCITYYESKVGVRQTRIYYHLEDIGKQRFNEMEREYLQSIQVISLLLNNK